MKKYNLCVELTLKEQQLLKETAARKKMTLSGFVTSLCITCFSLGYSVGRNSKTKK